MTIRIPSSNISTPTSPSPSSDVWAVDFRETAPSGSHKYMFSKDPSLSRFGGLSIGVPGEMRGLEAAYKLGGSLPWNELVEPVVKLAQGWKVSAELERRIKVKSPSASDGVDLELMQMAPAALRLLHAK